MRIAWDGRALVAPRTGIGWYTYHLLRGFESLAGDWRGSVIANRRIEDRFDPRIETETLRFPNTVRLRSFYEGILLPRKLNRLKPDVWHSPMTVIPEGLAGVRTVATVHDVAFRLFPGIQPPAYRNYWNYWTEQACKRADRIVAVSAATRRDLLEHFDADPEKVVVVHEAADPFMAQEIREEDLKSLRARYDLPDRFLFFVGTLEPRKNLSLLFEVYRIAREGGVDLPLSIVAGGKGWLQDRIEEEAAKAKDKVRFIGYLDREDLRAFYRLADLVLVPSLYEGFGLQAAEAMAAGAVVLASNVSSLPEVVGDGGVLLPPNEPEGWMKAIVELLEDSDGRKRWKKKARKQAKNFSWERAARETYRVYEAALG
jgi:glycosyltransferase involved in cell wall biosynthesis